MSEAAASGTLKDAAASAEPADQQLAIDTIRALSMDAVQKANSGHPGMPMAMAPAAYLLYTRYLHHNPRDPAWPDRDRFVLSAGHGSMLLYSVLHLSGYELSMEELKNFRQWGSLTPGHPERDRVHVTPGVETTTGPLGQGFANGVGMAMAERFLRERYGAEVMDHRVFAICSDGDLMEGVASEASSLAGHLGLGRLVYLYDDNHITIDGSTSLSFDSEDVPARFRAYGWHVQQVEDANDLEALSAAIEAGIAEEERPSLIDVRSIIGWPSPNLQGTAKTHGAPLGEDEVRATKEVMGWDPDKSFHVPDGVYEHWREAVAPGEQHQREWRQRLDNWRQTDPEAAAEWERAWEGRPEDGLADALPSFDPAEKDSIATRVASSKAIQALAPYVPTMIGGSADLAGSTNTDIEDEDSYTREHAGRNVHWGVREHAMGSAINGMALHGGIVRPFGSTFLQFSDYMRGAVRLSALMDLPVVWVYTHDSVGLGEDGPTHQPVEHYAALRAIPGLTVIRPGDPAEAVEAWRVTLEECDGPVCLLLTRQGLPVLDRTKLAGAGGLARGAYTLSEAAGKPPQAVVVATGSEVGVALEAQEQLHAENIEIRVVSMPSWELFDAQPPDYAESVFPPGLPVVSIEAGVAQGWERFAERSVAIDRFGASAPGAEVLTRLGITADAAAAQVRELVGESPPAA
ncbi:MAG: transketolase [Solirubrobacterales bacterium]